MSRVRHDRAAFPPERDLPEARWLDLPCCQCAIGRSMKDAVVVITGASKGIGAELARQLATKGARLVLAARNESELQEVADRCKGLGASVITVKADVAREHDCL